LCACLSRRLQHGEAAPVSEKILAKHREIRSPSPFAQGPTGGTSARGPRGIDGFIPPMLDQRLLSFAASSQLFPNVANVLHKLFSKIGLGDAKRRFLPTAQLLKGETSRCLRNTRRHAGFGERAPAFPAQSSTSSAPVGYGGALMNSLPSNYQNRLSPDFAKICRIACGHR